MKGIGFDWTGHFHGFRFGLVDHLLKPPVWESTVSEIPFVENLDANYGLLGMDVIRQWKELSIMPSPSGDGGRIQISI